MNQLTRQEQLMLHMVARWTIGTWLLNVHFLNAEALKIFNRLHKDGMFEPVDGECSAYRVSAKGQAALTAAHPPSWMDFTLKSEENA